MLNFAEAKCYQSLTLAAMKCVKHLSFINTVQIKDKECVIQLFVSFVIPKSFELDDKSPITTQ
jgi:hypothetical protein